MAVASTLETDWARAPPPSGPAWRRIANALYNPEEKSFLGRTPKRWAIVLTFYMVFYAVLTLMFAACMGGLFLTIDNKKPTYTLEKSLIGNNPGVASRPIPEKGFLVQLDVENATGHDIFTQQLDEFLQPYHNTKGYLTGECTNKDNFGYPESPCFYIKLNKIIGWEPDCYKDKANLPEDTPKDLRDYINQQQGPALNQIWLSCAEEHNNATVIEYPWGRGLPADKYPYTNADNYVPPLLALRLTPPANTLVIIRCRFWAKNIIYNKSLKEPSGYTRVQLQIINSTKVDI